MKLNQPFVEKESDSALVINGIVITERQYFVYNGSRCFRRKVYVQDNKVIAWAAVCEGQDTQLHMSIHITDNPRYRQLVEFIMRRNDIPRESLIQVYGG